MTKVEISVLIRVKRRRSGAKICQKPPLVLGSAFSFRCCFTHTSGSSTLVRTQTANRAGMMPTKNMTRQPNLGRMVAAQTAARM
jgi:hypothetical protein